MLSQDLLERILTKLKLSNRPENDFDGLSNLYKAWCQGVPFDNSRKLVHVNANDPLPLPGGDAIDFFESWLKLGTGGTCWAGNGALHALLSSLGFAAVRGVATMMVAPNLPPNHGTVVVKIDEQDYLVDASILHNTPMLLSAETGSQPSKSAPWVKELFMEDSLWRVRWVPLHRFTEIDCKIDYYPTDDADFQKRHEQTRGWSPFNYELTVRKAFGNKMLGICSGQRAEFKDGEIIFSDLSDDEKRTFLIDQLGLAEELVLRLPADQPTPPPPNSRTALNLQHSNSDAPQ